MTAGSATAATEGPPGARAVTKYYLIFLSLAPERPMTPEVVDLHAAHLAQLDLDGKLVLAGPVPERAGGMIVLRVGSVAEAKLSPKKIRSCRAATKPTRLAPG